MAQLYRDGRGQAIGNTGKSQTDIDRWAAKEDFVRGSGIPESASKIYRDTYATLTKEKLLFDQQMQLVRTLKDHGVPITGYTIHKAKKGAAGVLALIEQYN